MEEVPSSDEKPPELELVPSLNEAEEPPEMKIVALPPKDRARVRSGVYTALWFGHLNYSSLIDFSTILQCISTEF